jgi:DNA-binding response OmpR family regulator
MGVSYKILFVDDEEQVRNFIVSSFSKHGHSCETAKDGIEASEKLKENSFDSAAIDIVIPLMDGTITAGAAQFDSEYPISIDKLLSKVDALIYAQKRRTKEILQRDH